MIQVQQAEEIINACWREYGTTLLPLLQATGRVLAEPIAADRDLPPFHRVAMDGIAIRFADYDKGQRYFAVDGVVGAGEAAPEFLPENACFEIMTGAMLPPAADTIVPYEQLKIHHGIAEIVQDKLKKGQNIHFQGSDHSKGIVLIPDGKLIGPAEISVAASAGKTQLLTKRLPRIAIFSSGNELVEIAKTPLPYQIRRSNSYAIHAALKRYGLDATMLHLPDNLEIVTQELQKAKGDYDVLLLSGGISMGKFDYIPKALESIGVEQRFYKVQQRPGKPFWFGTFGTNGLVFALPGNPVSTHLCLIRYVLPWLENTLGFPPKPQSRAVLDRDFHFEPALQYFMQVKLSQDENAVLHATPILNKGSGDYASLLEADAFMELPANQTAFKAGQIFPIWSSR